MSDQKDGQYSDEESAKRRDEALKRALGKPHKPHKPKEKEKPVRKSRGSKRHD